jgi:quercetin dioxygenase-like cupin family protein
MAQSDVESSRNADPLAYKSPYELWKKSEGLPTIRGLIVDDLYTVELAPWKSRGGSGVFINLAGSGGFNDAYVCEIPPAGSLQPRRHIYEESTFILKGQGATTVWIEGKPKQTFEWQQHSFFAIPPNAWYQHHNLSGSEPTRYVSMTTAPRTIDQFRNLDFVFNNPFLFTDRFNGETGYFQEVPRERSRGRRWESNFVADVMDVTLKAQDSGDKRGVGAVGVPFDMVNCTVKSHSSTWPVGTYKKSHRHGPGIHVIILRGHGYSLMWPEGAPMQRFDWGPGAMFVPPEMWWHQHFNAGDDPIVFLAIGWGNDKPKMDGTGYGMDISVKEGGDQIEWEDEDPSVHRDFEAALAKVGASCMMGGVHPFCTASPRAR